MTFPSHVKFFIVGGYVRDRLLNCECNDHDFVVVGATPEMMIENGFQQVGADFPVFLNKAGDEYALARKERKVAAGYHGFETDFDTSVTLEEDLFRRDLTINAMAREVLSWDDNGHAHLSDEIIDPFNGRRDLEDGRIRHVSDAFGEDPVRVLRALRFAARYGFDIALETYDLMKWMVRDGELNHLTAERVWLEFEKTMTESVDTSDFLQMLEIIGALDILMPEIVKGLPAVQSPLEDADGHFASVAIKCAIITSHMNQQAVGDFWRRRKAPNEVVSLAVTSAMLRFTFEHCWEGTAEQILSTLKALAAFNNVGGMVDTLRVVTYINEAFTETATVLSTAQHITKDISFGSLTEDQQATLKGKEIGEAIDALRVKEIKQYLETRSFLGTTTF